MGQQPYDELVGVGQVGTVLLLLQRQRPQTRRGIRRAVTLLSKRTVQTSGAVQKASRCPSHKIAGGHHRISERVPSMVDTLLASLSPCRGNRPGVNSAGQRWQAPARHAGYRMPHGVGISARPVGRTKLARPACRPIDRCGCAPPARQLNRSAPGVNDSIGAAMSAAAIIRHGQRPRHHETFRGEGRFVQDVVECRSIERPWSRLWPGDRDATLSLES
jgi:hypothetical protein